MSAGSIISSLFGIGASIAKYENQKKVTAANIMELGRSARLEDSNAVDSLARGSFLAGLTRRKATQAIQEQEAAFGASGVDGGYGTANSIAATTRSNTNADAQQYLNNAAREAWGHKEVGRKYRNESGLLVSQQANQDIAFGIGLAGDVIGTGVDIATTVAGVPS